MPYLRTFCAWMMTVMLGAFVFLGLCFFQDNRAWEWGFRLWARTFLRIVGVRVHRTQDMEDLPPGIYVMNHQSIIDIVTLPRVAPQKATIVAKKQLFALPFVGFAMRKAGCILVDRQRSAKAIESIQEGLSHLPAGYSILIFPEGTRSGQSQVGQLKKGFFHMALQTGLPVVPVGQVGGDKLSRGKSIWTRSGDLAIHIGHPISTQGWSQQSIDQHIHEVRQQLIACCQRAEQEQWHAQSQ